MLILEPQTAYERRQRSVVYTGGPDCQRPSSNLAVPVIGRPAREDFWTELVFQTLGENADEPMRITSVANAVARLGDFSRRSSADNNAGIPCRWLGCAERVSGATRIPACR